MSFVVMAPTYMPPHLPALPVAEGQTNREIGEWLDVSRRTVETHIAHAFQQLDIGSRTQLAPIVCANISTER